MPKSAQLWLQVLPTEWAFVLPNAVVLDRIAVRFGFPSLFRHLPLRCTRDCKIGARCINNNSVLAHFHFETCKTSGCLIKRHDVVRNLVRKMAVLAGVTVELEPHIFGGIEKKRPDLTLTGLGGKYGRGTVAVDVTVRNPLKDTVVNKGRGDASAVLTEANKDKLKKYEEPCLLAGIGMLPLSASSYGVLSTEFVALLRHLSKLYRNRSDEGMDAKLVWPTQKFCGYWTARIASSIVKHSGMHVLSRARQSLEENVDFRWSPYESVYVSQGAAAV
jgi:hypothetical protein